MLVRGKQKLHFLCARATIGHMANQPDNPTLTPPDSKHKRLPARDARAQKLRKLKQQIEDGTYQVDSDAVAEKIIHKHLRADDKDQH